MLQSHLTAIYTRTHMQCSRCGLPPQKQTLTGILVYSEMHITAALMNTTGLFCVGFFLVVELISVLKHVAVATVEKVMDCESLSGIPVRKCFRV